MHKEESRKIPLNRSELLQKQQRRLLSEGMLFIAMAAIITVSEAIWSVITAFVFTDTPLVFWFVLLALAIALGGFSAYSIYLAIRASLPLLCLLTGKYTIEVDRVQRIELRSEKNRRYSRSLIAYLNKPDYITYQYVDFAKFGMYKTDPKQAFAQDQAFYVLVALTKTPTIVHLWSYEAYELHDR